MSGRSAVHPRPVSRLLTLHVAARRRLFINSLETVPSERGYATRSYIARRQACADDVDKPEGNVGPPLAVRTTASDDGNTPLPGQSDFGIPGRPTPRFMVLGHGQRGCMASRQWGNRRTADVLRNFHTSNSGDETVIVVNSPSALSFQTRLTAGAPAPAATAGHSHQTHSPLADMYARQDQYSGAGRRPTLPPRRPPTTPSLPAGYRTQSFVVADATVLSSGNGTPDSTASPSLADGTADGNQARASTPVAGASVAALSSV